MAKELPYFKFEPSEWDSGNIQMCSRESKGLFIDLCSLYWNRLGELPYALALQKLCNGSKDALQELQNTEIIAVIDGNLVIEFLDEQLSEFGNVSEKRRKAANKRWSDASALQMESKSNAIREEKIRVKEKKEDKIKVNDTNIVAVDTANKEKRELDFMESLKPYIGQYEKPMLREFYNYWIEPMKSGKMRFEAEKFWSLSRRLSTWSNNIKNNKYAKQPIGTPEDQRERIASFLASKEARTGNPNG